MSQFFSSWRVALRAGRRDIMRSKGRSALVATMVSTPVLLTVMLNSIIASNSISETEGLADQMGSAQAVVINQGGTNVTQSPDASSYGWAEKPSKPSTAELVKELEAVAGDTIIPVNEGETTTVLMGERGFTTEILGVDASQPATEGMYSILEGRAPKSTSEAAVSPKLADAGAFIGSHVSLGDGTHLQVVGIGKVGTVARGGDRSSIIVLPSLIESRNSAHFLIDRPGPVTWADVKEFNKAGFVVLSRHVLHNPPPASQRYSEYEFGIAHDNSAERAVIMIAATAILIQVILLAGPAFAVGVKRQRRELALFAATGASPSQIRRIVLGQALALGFLSCFAGAILGVGLASVFVWLSPHLFPVLEFGPFEVSWLAVAASILLGSLASMGAAFMPARQASKQNVAAVLAGRRGTMRSSRGWPVVGSILIAAGIIACFMLGTQPGGEFVVAISTISIVLGALCLTPLMIGVVGRVGTNLPLPLRLAVRDTSRQRSRSTPAIAAIMASVAAITTLAIASSSDFAQSRRDHLYETSPGRMLLHFNAKRAEKTMAKAAEAAGFGFTALGQVSYDRGFEVEPVPPTDDEYGFLGNIYVADAATLADWGVQLDDRQQDVMNKGGALVYDAGLISQGKLALAIYHDGSERQVKLDAAAADLRTWRASDGQDAAIRGTIISSETAAELQIPWHAETAISDPNVGPISKAVESRVDQAIKALTPDYGGAMVERGFRDTFTLQFLALAGFGALAVLIGTLTATGLALNDARPDFSTLAAIGAAPRTRRLLAGSQAMVLALLGTLLGIAVGFAPGVAATWPLTSVGYSATGESVAQMPVIDIPWILLGVLAIVIPMFASAVALLFTRNRLDIVRRLAQ